MPTETLMCWEISIHAKDTRRTGWIRSKEGGRLRASDRRIALQRIHVLFQSARNLISEDEELAQRQIAVARRISMSSRVRIPREFRRQLCRGCKRFIVPGISSRVRVQQHRTPHVVVTCGYCGKHMRFPIKTGGRKKGDNTKGQA